MANKRFIVRHGLDNSGDNSVVNTIINVAEPVNNSDAATKYYVDTHTTGGTVTSVTATSPVESTGGTAPVISLGTGANGQLVIGTGTGFTKSTLTAGSGVSIANASGSITISATGSGGDVTGPNSSTDNAVVRFDGLSGKIIQDSTATLSDAGLLTVSELSTTSITSTGGATITIAPNGMGDVHLNADSVRIGDNNTDAILTTHGTGDLILTTNEGSATEGVIRLYDGANGNITLTPNGTGQVQVGSDQVVTLTASQTLTNKSLSGSSNTFTNIPNSATTAASANTASAIVARDASGNFSAGTITATLSGNATNVTGTVAVANGGTGLTSLTAGYIPYGNGTSAFGSSADLFWDSANSRLGVGTTSPAQRLTVSGGNLLVNSANPDVGGIYLQATTGTNACAMTFDNSGGKGYVGLDSSAGSRISGVAYALSVWHEGNNPIAFGTNNTERMRITSGGSVGIGTGSPAQKLSVSGNISADSLKGTSTSYNVPNFITPRVSDDNWTFGIHSDDSSTYFMQVKYDGANSATRGFRLYDVGTSSVPFLVTGQGNLGLGTSSPDIFGRFYTRSVGISSSGSTILQINGSSYGGIDLGAASIRTGSITGSANDIQMGSITSIPLLFVTNGTERMRIDSSGNLGLGTSSPSAILHAKSSASGANASAIIENAGSTATSLLYFKNNASRQMLMGYTGSSYAAGEYGVIDVLGAYPLVFATSDTERMRIDSSGNLLIGNTNGTEKLTVTGNIRASGVYVGNGSTGDWNKGFGGIKLTTTTSTPTGGQSGDFVFIY